MEQNIFPAKLLLFGEYTVLFGGYALAMPTYAYRLIWADQKRPVQIPNLVSYLQQINPSLIHPFPDHYLQQWAQKGFSFESNIPIGYGLGSSGALSAAIYSCGNPASTTPLQNALHDLALIEAFFHGKSSGTDPAVSYFKQSLLKMEKRLHPVSVPPFTQEVYLLDSNQGRSAQKMIEFFQRQLAISGFSARMQEIAALSNLCINLLMEGKTYWPMLLELSTLQFEVMTEFIPKKILDIWGSLLDQEDMAIKLCGAGGGGFFLLFAQDPIPDSELATLHGKRVITSDKSDIP